MWGENRCGGLRAAAWIVLCVGLVSAWAGEAAAECGWFPDFDSDCDRRGRWEGFESPFVHPYLFEDPFITTNAVAHYIWQDFPGRSALGGGDLHAVALQLRVALTDRLAFIATKDGYAWVKPESPLLDREQGWMNLAAGFKYQLVKRPDVPFALTGSLVMELATGTKRIFQDDAKGVIFQPAVSAAWGRDRFHLIGNLGSQVPTDMDKWSTYMFTHLYADYQVWKHLQPFVQLSGNWYIRAGNGDRTVRLTNGAKPTLDQVQQLLGTHAFEGGDLLNLGSDGIENNGWFTWAIGTHFPINRHATVSFAYERPLSERKDLMNQRITTVLRLEF